MRGQGGRTWLRFAVVWMGIAAMIVGVTVMPRVYAAEPDVPTLFYNDAAWAMDNYYPSLGYTVGSMEDFWLPLSFYEEIDGIRVTRGTARNHTIFVVQDTVSGKYLSFNVNDSTYAQTERSTLILIHTMLYSKERYLPMRDLCAYFGWTFEISDDHRSVRICDGRQQKTFDELLAVYRPPVVTDTQTGETTEDQTQPPDTEPMRPGIYLASSVHLTFEDIDDVHTPALLDSLALFGARGTFFVTGEQMAHHTDIVLRILTEGHSIGLHGMTADESVLYTTEGMLESLAEENELLCALVGRKTRFVRMPNGSRSGRLYLTAAQKRALEDTGYLLWDWNISAMDHDPVYTPDMVLEKIDTALRLVYVPVIRMHCTELAAQVLPTLLQRLEDAGVKTAQITEASSPVVFP